MKVRLTAHLTISLEKMRCGLNITMKNNLSKKDADKIYAKNSTLRSMFGKFGMTMVTDSGPMMNSLTT